ncbi:hypothetical protein RclHR1_01700014 [Rhizophagus clarus]|uniref:Uncharacterized protein n=1 Tax=Rhizophagus clarus TaxID=94130 RepID=A0A2Z6QZM1_9GLOM|nr:hypothetical protein RclHR1_01700014 [Rhizophagus clarus]
MSIKDTIRGLIATIFILLVFACPALEISKIILFKSAKHEITLENTLVEYFYLVVALTFPCRCLNVIYYVFIDVFIDVSIDVLTDDVFNDDVFADVFTDSSIDVFLLTFFTILLIVVLIILIVDVFLFVEIEILVGLIFTAVKNLCCNMGELMSHIREQLCCLPFLILIIASIYTHMTSQDIAPIPSSCPSNYPYKLSITRVTCIIRLINLITMWTFISLLLILTIVDCFGYFPSKEKGKTIESRLSDFFPPERDDDIDIGKA